MPFDTILSIMRDRSMSGRMPALACLVAGLAMPLAAQSALTRLPSDTGRMLRGGTDFSGYVTPGMCKLAVWSISGRTTRAGGRDTTALAANLHDTLPSSAVAAGKRCLANFSATTVIPAELRNFQQLALAIGDDALAQTAASRRLTLATTLDDSALVLRDGVEDLLAARPIRLASARKRLDQLELMGARVGVRILEAQAFYLRAVRITFDVAQIKHVTNSILALGNMLPSAERDQMASTLKDAWLARRDVAYWESPDSVPSTLAQMSQEMALLRGGNMMGPFDREWKAFDEIVLPQLSKPLKNLPGSPRYVFPASPSPELLAGQLPRGAPQLVFITHAGHPLMMLGMVRRLQDKYGPLGLKITYVMATLGYTSWNGSGVYTPSQEVESIRELLFQQLRLPVSLVVEELSVDHRLDGRKRSGPMQWYARTPALTLLIDGDGVLRMGFDQYTPEAVIDAHVGRMMGRGVAQDRGSRDAR